MLAPVPPLADGRIPDGVDVNFLLPSVNTKLEVLNPLSVKFAKVGDDVIANGWLELAAAAFQLD